MENSDPAPSCLCFRLTEDRLSSSRGQSASLQSSITTRLMQEVFTCSDEKLMDDVERYEELVTDDGSDDDVARLALGLG